KGEKLTVEQLLYALMLPSANDAARQLAIACSGSVDEFCKVMNERAKECGAENTHYTNPNGLNLPGQEHHKTTAYDLTQITKEAMANEKFRELVSTKKYTIPATNKSEERKLKSTNLLLYSKKSVEVDDRKIPLRYPLATGVKTGTTTPAGNCFVGTAKDGDMELIVVTLNSGDITRFTDAIQLFDYGFDKYDTVVGAAKGDEVGAMKVTCGKTGRVAIGASKSLAMTVEAKETEATGAEDEAEEAAPEYKYSIQLDTNEKKLTAPFEAGTVVGTVSILDEDGNVRNTVDAVTIDGVEEGGLLSHYGIPDDMLPLVIATIITLILIIIVAVIIRKRKQGPVAAAAASEVTEADPAGEETEGTQEKEE
ncbi:MAG: D-alanyl-D-alanine carboxypeptidase, partial [Eubacterium sp.]|nr:D-alanyl-D-alanine carboxypeptidase [Candidatus Colimonas fimequi]